METRASRVRDLSRSGQPRRRLARRRQHLPNPVRRRRRAPNVFVGVDSADVRELLMTPVRVDLLNPIVIESGSELEVDVVG